MAEQKSGSNVGKIVLIVVLVLCGVGAVCGGVLWYFGKSGFELAKSSAAFQQSLVAEFGPDVRFQPVTPQPQNLVLAVGFGEEEDLSPEHVRELQDEVWKLYTEAFADAGMPFTKSVAVGRGHGAQQGGYVSDWEENQVSVEELTQRTGIAAPPPSSIEKLVPEKAKIKVNPPDETEKLPGGEPEEDAPNDVPDESDK